jgi:S1-C subfamily serine protease
MGTGGLLLEDLDAEERKRLGFTAADLALRAKHVGEYGDHATAKRAGFVKGDIIVAVDGIGSRMSEGDLIARAVQEKKPGDRFRFTVRRGDELKELSFAVK